MRVIAGLGFVLVCCLWLTGCAHINVHSSDEGKSLISESRVSAAIDRAMMVFRNHSPAHPGNTKERRDQRSSSVQWLLDQQQADGGWLPRHDPAATAAAVLALISASDPGNDTALRNAIHNGITHLLRIQAADGSWVGNHTPAISHALSVWALSWALGVGIRDAPELHQALASGADYILERQGRTGGWSPAYVTGQFRTTFTTTLQIVALREAATTGWTHPDMIPVLTAAAFDLFRAQDANSGIVGNELPGIDRWSATETAMLGWALLGLQDTRPFRRAVFALDSGDRMAGGRPNEPLLEMLIKTYALRYADDVFSRQQQQMIKREVESRRRPDGSWPATSVHSSRGDVFSTSVCILFEHSNSVYPYAPGMEQGGTAWTMQYHGAAHILFVDFPASPSDTVLLDKALVEQINSKRLIEVLDVFELEHALSQVPASVLARRDAKMSGHVKKIIRQQLDHLDAGYVIRHHFCPEIVLSLMTGQLFDEQGWTLHAWRDALRQICDAWPPLFLLDAAHVVNAWTDLMRQASTEYDVVEEYAAVSTEQWRQWHQRLIRAWMRNDWVSIQSVYDSFSLACPQSSRMVDLYASVLTSRLADALCDSMKREHDCVYLIDFWWIAQSRSLKEELQKRGVKFAPLNHKENAIQLRDGFTFSEGSP